MNLKDWQNETRRVHLDKPFEFLDITLIVDYITLYLYPTNDNAGQNGFHGKLHSMV